MTGHVHLTGDDDRKWVKCSECKGGGIVGTNNEYETALCRQCDGKGGRFIENPAGLVEAVMARVEKVEAEHILDEERKKGIKIMLRALGENPDREGLLDTPRRVVKAWREITSGYTADPKKLLTVFANDEHFTGMVCVGPVQFYSTCEHHLLPFFGKAWVAYIPNGKLIGLSKLPRLVEMYARRLQNQERLTSQVVKALGELLETDDVACVMKAQHFCMMSRGVRQDDAFMVTPQLSGRFMSQPSTRAEFMAHVTKE